MQPFGIPIDLGPRLIGRALSDLAAIARVARDVPERLDRLDQRAQQMQDQIERMLVIAEDIAALGHSVVEIGRSLDRQATGLLSLGDRVSEQGDVIAERAREVADRGGELVAVLPTLEKAIAFATPLEGTVERLGRMVDRLPGGNKPTTQKAPAKPKKKATT